MSDVDFDLALRAQAVDERLRFLLPILLLQVLLDLCLCLLERHDTAGLLVDNLDDVETERRLDNVAHLARLEREGGVVERTDHLTLLEVPQVAALGCAAGILRIRL